MDLLREGVEPSVIALWLGHESVKTKQVYPDDPIRHAGTYARISHSRL